MNLGGGIRAPRTKAEDKTGKKFNSYCKKQVRLL
jgi:hypothetical protein